MSDYEGVMLDVVPGWLRIKPSGFVHLVVRANSQAKGTACGRRVAAAQLTIDYPSAAKRCPNCVASPVQ